MQPTKSLFKRWLTHQQLQLDHCTSALLVQLSDQENFTYIARTPEQLSLDNAIEDKQTTLAISETLRKQRLYLLPLTSTQLLLAHPIKQQGKLWGAVVLTLSNHDKKTVAEALKRLQQGISWLQFLLSQPEPHLPAIIPAENNEAASHLPLLTRLLKEKSLQETCISLVNSIAVHCGSVRVCLGLNQTKTMALAAVSFSANFDNRTANMQAVCDAMDEAADQRLDIYVAANTPTNNTQSNTQETINQAIITHHHQSLIKQQNITVFRSYLLRKNERILGAITLEFATTDISPLHEKWLHDLLPMACDLISIKQDAEMTLRRKIKTRFIIKLLPWLNANRLTKKITGAAALIGLLIMFIPKNYWITSDANLQSTYRYLVVAPQDGYLASIKVRPGDAVKIGDTLAQLNDDNVRLERQKLFSQLQQSQQEYDHALANANRAQAAIANEKVAQANSQLQLIEQQQLRTQLFAPSAGIITSNDISQSLGAPVKQGQTLFEISANQGYVVQLWIEERDITYIKLAQPGKIKLTSLPNDLLDVRVKSITPISEIREGKNYFRVEASVNRETLLLRPGMTGSAKILVGQQRVGWIWFHDIWSWLRLKLWL